METTKPIEIRPGSAALWTGVLSGPFAFAAAFELKYAMLTWICDHHAEWLFWAITAAALLLCAFGAFESRRGGAGATRAEKRVRFMSLGGLALNATFAICIIAMAVPHLYLGACE
jgi:hypothetical protein